MSSSIDADRSRYERSGVSVSELQRSARALTLVLAGELKLVFDRRILDEYAGCLHVRALVSIQRT